MEREEHLARELCKAQGVDPDARSFAYGESMNDAPREWLSRVPLVRAVLKAASDFDGKAAS